MHNRRALVLLPLLAACGREASFMSAGDIGVSAGGSEDITYARAMIEDGLIPNEEMFTSEGLMSEHDLPVDGEDCADVLCPRGAVARIDPVDGSGEQLLFQLGFGTKYATEPFERAPLRVAATVDVSGSMSGEKLDLAKDALRTMVAQLNDGDEMALIAFGDRATVERAMTVMDESGRERMLRSIDGLSVNGSTSVEAGLIAAYDELAPEAGAVGVEDRVMVFTDAQPNVGATGVDSFVGMATYYGEAGIGTTVIGVGYDMGTELANALSKTRGGNYHFIADEADVEQVFDEEFDMMVSPVAYDLRVHLSPAGELSFLAGYGVPLDGADVELGASTLFLSARDGGMGATMIVPEGSTLPESGAIASMALDYLPVDDEPVSTTLDASFAGGAAYTSSTIAADDLGVFKMGVLIDAYLALMAGSEFCVGALSQEEALARVEAAASHVQEVGSTLSDAPLTELAMLLQTLHANLEVGAERCLAADTYEY